VLAHCLIRVLSPDKSAFRGTEAIVLAAPGAARYWNTGFVQQECTL